MLLFNKLKNYINIFQIKHDKRVNCALKKADLLISSIPDSYQAIKRYKHLESVIIPETGCYTANELKADLNKYEKKALKILWVGKFDFRKQLQIIHNIIKSLMTTNKILQTTIK